MVKSKSGFYVFFYGFDVIFVWGESCVEWFGNWVLLY